MSGLNDIELLGLFKDLESDRSERKASDSDKNKICQAICAFANDLSNNQLPGVIFIGVNDNGTCAETEITDQMLLNLTDLKSNGNIHPFPVMSVQKKELDGCTLAVITVEPSKDTPIAYKGVICIRSGPRRGVATNEEVRILTEKRKHGDLPFDLHPVDEASIDDDLDLTLFKEEYLRTAVDPEILAQNDRSIEEQLASLRFINDMENRKPTVVGILALGTDPVQHLPGAYIQFLRIDGEELTDPIKDRKQISGSISRVLRLLDDIFEAHISVSSDITTGSTEISRPEYPIVALREIARNAVMHRNYEGTNAPVRITWFNDRIEIQSPGGPYGQVSVETFGAQGVTDYRNPHLAEVLKSLGYVQKFGVGISLARKEMEKNGNPDPEFVAELFHCLVVLRKAV